MYHTLSGALGASAGLAGPGAPRTAPVLVLVRAPLFVSTPATRVATPASRLTLPSSVKLPGPARAAGAPNAPDSVWYIDVSKGGAYCVANPASLVLWRPNRSEEANAKLTPIGGKPVDIVWKKGNPLKLWPSTALPVVEGGRYTFSDPVGPSVTLVLHLLATIPTDDLGVAGMLAEKGCTAQLDVFANSALPASGSGR